MTAYYDSRATFTRASHATVPRPDYKPAWEYDHAAVARAGQKAHARRVRRLYSRVGLVGLSVWIVLFGGAWLVWG